MNINILNINNKFAFDIREEGKCIFSSCREGLATNLTASYYEKPWKACHAARNFVRNNPFHLIYKEAYEVNDASSGYAEGEGITIDKTPSDFLNEHYLSILKRLTVELRNPPKEDKDLLHMSLTSFIMELANLYQLNAKQKKIEEAKTAASLLKKFKSLLTKKFGGKMAKVDMQALNQQLNPQKGEAGGGGLPGMASRKTFIVTAGELSEEDIDSEVALELLEEYATKACEAIQETNKVFYKIEYDNEHYYINIYQLCDDGSTEKIIVIRINKFYHIDSIIPVGKLNKIYPYHSVYFYQKYWKPIVENVGHYYLEDTDSLIVSDRNELPDLPKNDDSYSLEAWDVSDRKLENIDISFKSGDVWFFENSKSKTVTASSKYTEQNYINAMVMCIDKTQPELYGELGQVIQVIPLQDFIEVDVKFITFADENSKITKEQEDVEFVDGLVVRLAEDQIKILTDAEIASLKLGI